MSKLFLALLLVAYLVLGTAYAVYTPAWQVPDEPAHFNYVRSLAEAGRLPVLKPDCYPHEYLETLKAARFPADMSVDGLCYEAHQPPLYYLLASPVLRLTGGLPLGQRVVVLRLLSVVLGVVLLLIAWRIVRLVFPEDLPLALASVGLVAFLPMHLTMVAAVNNDTLAELVMAAILWLGLSRLRGTLSAGRYAALGGLLLAVALLTKTTIYAPSIVVLAGGELGRWWLVLRQGDKETRKRGMSLVYLSTCVLVYLRVVLLALILSGWWFIRNALTYGWMDPFGWGRHDAVVAGQLRTAEWMAEVGARKAAQLFLTTTFKSFWGIFGWMGVPMDERTYWVLFLVSAVAGLGLLLFAWRTLTNTPVWPRGTQSVPAQGPRTAATDKQYLIPQQRLALSLLALPPLLAFVALLWYNLSFVQHQGRYLFPGLVPLALFFTLGLREVLSAEHEGLLLGLWTIGLAGLAGYSLLRFIVPNL